MRTENQQNDSCKVRIHIGFRETMDLRSLEDAICLVNESVTDFYRETNRYDLVESSPRVLSVGNGSFIIDILLRTVTEVAIKELLKHVVKVFAERRKNYTIKAIVFPNRMKWTDEDNLAVCIAVLREYVLQESNKDYRKLAASLHLSKPFSNVSVEDKIKNTKQLLKENRIDNTLNCGTLTNYSKPHKKAFQAACVLLGIETQH